MSSYLLTSLGLDWIDLGIVLIAMAGVILLLLILLIVVLVKQSHLKKKYNKFMKGADGKSLETDIGRIYNDSRVTKKKIENLENGLSELDERVKGTIQKVGVVKYDAFRQMGGELSYAIALLDDRENGVMINSVHSADGCYSYSKVIKRGRADVDLGSEEQKALDMAKNSK